MKALNRIICSSNIYPRAKTMGFKSVHEFKELLDNQWFLFDCEDHEIEKTVSGLKKQISGGLYE